MRLLWVGLVVAEALAGGFVGGGAPPTPTPTRLIARDISDPCTPAS